MGKEPGVMRSASELLLPGTGFFANDLFLPYPLLAFLDPLMLDNIFHFIKLLFRYKSQFLKRDLFICISRYLCAFPTGKPESTTSPWAKVTGGCERLDVTKTLARSWQGQWAPSHLSCLRSPDCYDFLKPIFWLKVDSVCVYICMCLLKLISLH